MQLVCHCLIFISGLNSFLKALILVFVVNPAKCCLVIHDSYKSNAEQLFSSLGVSVVCNHRYLGGFTGELTGLASFVRDKVHRCIADVQCLSKIAKKQPQAAFAALTKSLQCEWQFLRVISNCGSYFIPLDDVLASTYKYVYLCL